MTEPRPVDDELVSALLDDALTDEERARLADDPAVDARLAELRAVRELVAAPVPPPDPSRRDAAIAAALAAAGPAAVPVPAQATGAANGTGAGSPVVDLAARRRTRMVSGLSAAAAVVVVVLLAAGLLRGTTSRTADTTTAAGAPTTTSGARASSSPSTPAADGREEHGKSGAGEQPTAASGASPVVPDAAGPVTGGVTAPSAAEGTTDLGTLTSPDDLRRVADRAFALESGNATDTAPTNDPTTTTPSSTRPPPTTPGPSGAPTTTTPQTLDPAVTTTPGGPTTADAGATACTDASVRRAPGLGAFHGGDTRLGGLLGQATARYQGRPVVVLAFEAGPTGAAPRVFAVDASSCRLVAVAPD